MSPVFQLLTEYAIPVALTLVMTALAARALLGTLAARGARFGSAPADRGGDATPGPNRAERRPAPAERQPAPAERGGTVGPPAPEWATRSALRWLTPHCARPRDLFLILVSAVTWLTLVRVLTAPPGTFAPWTATVIWWASGAAVVGAVALSGTAWTRLKRMQEAGPQPAAEPRTSTRTSVTGSLVFLAAALIVALVLRWSGWG